MRVYRRKKTGPWWVAYFDASKGEHVRKSTHLDDRKAAFALGVEWERRGADPDGHLQAQATIADALDALIYDYRARAKEGRNAEETVDFYEKRAEQVFRMVGEGALPVGLAELRARHIDALIDRRRAEGCARSTIAKDLIVLRLALKLAKRRGMWAGDIDAVMPHRFGGSSDPRIRWLPPAEVWALCAELPPHRAAWVAFQVATSANMSETQKAHRDDVSRGFVHVRGTKADSRDRRVPIVRPWQRALLDAALSALPSKGPLFTPWVKVVRDLHLACGRAKIERCSTNDLRRTFGTWLRAEGTAIENIASAMGHVDSRMAERVYARLSPELLAGVLAGLGGVRPVYVTGGTNDNRGTDGTPIIHENPAI